MILFKKGNCRTYTFKTKILYLALLLTVNLFSQKTIVNPNGKWFFGAELGTNNITPDTSEPTNLFQGGLVAEYYFARHWSFTGKIKYYDIGVSFFVPFTPATSGSKFSSGSPAVPEYFGNYKGSAISAPINLKWEFRVRKNLAASIRLGATYNLEIKNNYFNTLNSADLDVSKNYTSFQSGLGINYFVNNQMAVYIDVDYFFSEFIATIPNYRTRTFQNNSTLTSFGIKYCFKKQDN